MSIFVQEKKYILQMPQGYVDIEAQEMEYVDGGWSWSTLGENLKGLYNKFSFASRAIRNSGITYGMIGTMCLGYATVSKVKVAAVLGTIAAANWVIGIAIGVTAGVAIYSMGTWRLFY